jgi:signal transduction histidine kinase
MRFDLPEIMPVSKRANPIALLGKSESLNWRTHLWFAAPAFATATLFDLDRVSGGALSWLGLATVGYLVTIFAIILGSRILRKKHWLTPKPLLIVLLLLLAGFLRGGSIYTLGTLFDIVPTSDLAFRLAGGPVFVLATYVVFNWLIDEYLEYTGQLQRIDSQGERLSDSSSQLELEILSLQDLQKAKIREMLSPAIWELQKLLDTAKSKRDLSEAIFQLRTISERIVRPLSQSLSNSTSDKSKDDTNEILNSRKRYRWPKTIHFHDAIRTPLFLIASIAIGAGAMFTSYGIVGGLAVLLLSATVSLLGLGAVTRFARFQIATSLGLLLTVLLGAVMGAFVAAAASLLQLTNFEPFLIQALVFYGMTLPSTYALGVLQIQRDTTLGVAEDGLEALRLFNSRLAQRAWLSRKTLAMELHGSIQGALQSVAMRLSRLESPSAKDLDRAMRDINAALEKLNNEDHLAGKSIKELLKDLQSLWAGALEIQLALSESALAVLDKDTAVSRCALEVVREAVTNAVKHGDAQRARVMLELSGQFVELLIENDGTAIGDAPNGQGLNLYASVSHTYQFERMGRLMVLRLKLPLSASAAPRPQLW